jgi:RimJ/RimL family protein N-acetyltransferase
MLAERLQLGAVQRMSGMMISSHDALRNQEFECAPSRLRALPSNIRAKMESYDQAKHTQAKSNRPRRRRFQDRAASGICGWPPAYDALLPPRAPWLDRSTTITTPRLSLTPLRPEDADEMTAVLDDTRLYKFIGGRPATLSELCDRYTKLTAGSPDPDEVWLNWIVRRRGVEAIGTVQATLTTRHGRSRAHIAWIVGTAWQQQGFASEAARALVEWLHRRGVRDIRAHIHPDHRASELVAVRAGLRPSDEFVDGERVWQSHRE